MSRSQVTSTVGQNTGGAVSPYVAGKNAVINGGMDIWQRGTSFASTGGSYTADRWWSAASGSGSTTFSRQSAGSTLPQIQYCIRSQRNIGSAELTSQQIGYTLETADSLRFAGQTITVSFYARAGANYSAASGVLYFLLSYGTGTDQRLLGAGFTGSTNILFQGPVISTSWQRISYSIAIPSTATEIGFYWQANVAGTALAADYFDITGVQLEVGSVATPFSRNAGTIQGELAACQRYYATSIPDGYTVSTFPINAQGQSGCAFYNNTGNDLWGNLMFPVRMRTAPTLTLYSQSNRTAGSLRDANTGSDVAMGTYAPTAGNGSNVTYITATGLTTGRFYSGQWTASAEL